MSVLTNVFLQITDAASQAQCVRGGAQLRANNNNDCPAANSRRQATVKGTDTAAASHQCMAAKNRAKELVSRDFNGKCDNFIQLDGDCVADNDCE